VAKPTGLAHLPAAFLPHRGDACLQTACGPLATIATPRIVLPTMTDLSDLSDLSDAVVPGTLSILRTCGEHTSCNNVPVQACVLVLPCQGGPDAGERAPHSHHQARRHNAPGLNAARRTLSQAIALKAALEARGYRTFCSEVDIPKGKDWWVGVGCE
jgi:hypothetical protein